MLSCAMCKSWSYAVLCLLCLTITLALLWPTISMLLALMALMVALFTLLASCLGDLDHKTTTVPAQFQHCSSTVLSPANLLGLQSPSIKLCPTTFAQSAPNHDHQACSVCCRSLSLLLIQTDDLPVDQYFNGWPGMSDNCPNSGRQVWDRGHAMH